jgi:hypothetical protein
MSKTEENATPADADAGEIDFSDLFAELFGTMPEPELDESRSAVVYVGDTPVRITVEYQTGHAYEAAQAQQAFGSPLTILSFLQNFADDSVDAKLSELGLDRAGLTDAVFALINKDEKLPETESASVPVSHDPLVILRDGADVDSLIRA